MNSDSWAHYLNRPTTPDEERLYYHFRHCLTEETPQQVIERFHQLFIEASRYPDQQVWRSLMRIVDSAYNTRSDQEFKFILNRCCYTLINAWQLQHRYHSAIPKLIDLFEALPADAGYAPTTKRLRELVRQFTSTEQYASLRRLPQVLFETDNKENWDDQLLGTLIQRYPYLYEHCLLTKDSDSEQKKNIQQLRHVAQQKFETDLARYDNHRTRRLVLTSVKNPTLLSDAELDSALDHYLGKVDGRYSHQEAAKQFIVSSRSTRSYREFKEELSDYLIVPLMAAGSNYANQFKRKLQKDFLQDLLPDADPRKVNDFLLHQTCRKLLSRLTIESRWSPQHHTFIDLIGNIGYTLTMGLLLRIVLFCRTMKPYFEQRFALLFTHYETSKRHDVDWLVLALEHVNIALSTNLSGNSFKASVA